MLHDGGRSQLPTCDVDAGLELEVPAVDAKDSAIGANPLHPQVGQYPVVFADELPVGDTTEVGVPAVV